MALSRLKVRRIVVNGELQRGVYPKDVILKIISELGVKGGLGYAYEYAGDVFDHMSMEGRMTVCNMSIEGGARIGYVNPDETTFAFIHGKDYAPNDFDKAKAYWASIRSDDDAEYDDELVIDGSTIEPMVTWGINPGQSVPVSSNLPKCSDFQHPQSAQDAYAFMGFSENQSAESIPIDVAFIGSCTNGRLSDLREAASIVKGKKIHPKVQAMVVPGSQRVMAQAESEGLHHVFIEAGFQWRNAGCSMCLAMNPDKLTETKSVRRHPIEILLVVNSPNGRTLLMSPAMVAAAAVAGHVVDVRKEMGHE